MTKKTNEPTVVLAVTGSIAAYKAALVARLLVKAGARVRPIMTESATRFLGPATMAGICSERVLTTMWSEEPGEPHVELGATADAIAVVPATAELIGDLARGGAGDLVRATLLCAKCPIVAAPAMHPRMWAHPATQRNVAQVLADGRVTMVGPVEGEVASGDTGLGRMAEPEDIVHAIVGQIRPRDLEGISLVVTAGPTIEDIDPARYISNRSSGKMGFAIAERAAARGAQVQLVAGPVSLNTPAGVTRHDVRSARQMKSALDDRLDSADALIMVAAVADYRPASVATEKMKRSTDNRTIELVPNPDLLSGIGAARKGKRPYLVGFALETATGEQLIDLARGKLTRKRVDLIVANRADDAFDKDDNRIVLVSADDAEPLERASKAQLADRILDRVAAACNEDG